MREAVTVISTLMLPITASFMLYSIPPPSRRLMLIWSVL
jgi:hypothetical protein